MENGGSSGSGPNSPAQAVGGSVPRRQPRAGADPLLIVCRCFGVVTAATALLCVAVNVLSAVHSFRGGIDVSPAARASPVLLIPPMPAMGARERADWGFMRVLVGSSSSADNRGHIPVLRGGVRHLRRRSRDRVGVHHQVLEGLLCSLLPISLRPIWDATDWL